MLEVRQVLTVDFVIFITPEQKYQQVGYGFVPAKHLP